MTKPIIVVKVPCKLLYVIQVKEFLIKCSTSWPYLISEFLVAYMASDWPCTYFTPKVFLFSIYSYSGSYCVQLLHLASFTMAHIQAGVLWVIENTPVFTVIPGM